MNAVVIADDLSGAAELAAAAANLGCSAEVQTSFNPSSKAEVVAIDADTRGISGSEAAEVIAMLTRDVLRAEPRWIYKKTDSVLRGNVRAEIESMLHATGLPRALLVPANPSKGRIIRDGIYLVAGTPLAKTAFAIDPEHPRRTSSVLELLGETGNLPVRRVSADEDLPGEGIIAPDVTDPADVKRHAARVDDRTLPAGGVEFFEALLAVKRKDQTAISAHVPKRLDGATLFVCGSAHAWDQGRGSACARYGMAVLSMPDDMRSGAVADDDAVAGWAERIANAISASGRALVAIGRAQAPDEKTAPPHCLADLLAQAVAGILRRGTNVTLCVEGGSTASALLRAMGWTRLTAQPSPGLAGVAALRPEGIEDTLLFVKPGSYPWPAQLWPEATPEGV
ncbi:MAG TPA: four-carbon acid sugar kinase family protein [Tepidisphaeraceae bacterium]|jgi:uncharacterized protein YgbK (DUF1537 family)